MANIIRNLTFGKAVIIGLILTAIYWAAMYDDGVSIVTEIESLKSEKVTSEGEIKRISKAIEDAKLFEQTMEQLGDEMSKIQTAIPSNFGGVDLLKLISNIAKDTGSSINSISDNGSSTVTEDSIYRTLSVAVSLTGSYNQMMTFLSSLTKSDKLLTVKTLQLNGRVVGDASPVMQMNVVVSGYQYIPKPGAK